MGLSDRKVLAIAPLAWLLFPAFFGGLLGPSGNAAAQEEISRRERINLERHAEELMQNYRYHRALGIYQKLDSAGQLHHEDIYRIAVCYLNEDRPRQAIPFFEKALNNEHSYPKSLYYYLAKSYHQSHRWEDALHYYKLYKMTLKKRHEEERQMIERAMQMCHTGQKLMADSLEVSIHNLGPVVNSEFPEYAPVLTADEETLLFTSNRPNTTGGKKFKYDGLYYEDIYISEKDPEGRWTPPKKVKGGVNTESHDASIFLTPDGQELIFYRFEKALVGAGQGDLYISDREGNTFGQPRELEALNSRGWEPSAAMTEDQQRLFVASDRKGGYGGVDLWYSEKQKDGSWGELQNMGPTINTPYDEDSPLIHPDGETLYFSSKGHTTMGGYDVFVSHWNEKQQSWSKPKNVGYPLNTAQDDIHQYWSADGTRVYFASIRPGGHGEKDLYYAQLQKEPNHLLEIRGKVVDSLSQKPLQASIQVREEVSGETTHNFQSNSASGEYVLFFSHPSRYTLKVKAEGYETHRETIETHELKAFKLRQKDIRLVPLDN